jgi:hypothetical protein
MAPEFRLVNRRKRPHGAPALTTPSVGQPVQSRSKAGQEAPVIRLPTDT